jgi:hypothetical protein
MRIRLSQLRQIIKEELQRNLMFEGVLDDSLAPQEMVSDKTKWLSEMVTKISEQLKKTLEAQNGKEVAQFLQIDTTPGDRGTEKAVLQIYFDEGEFINAIKRYIQNGRKPSNEFIDELVEEGEKQISPEDLKDGLRTMFKDSFKPAITDRLKNLGFTEDGKYLSATTSFSEKDKQIYISFATRYVDQTILELSFWIADAKT